MPTTPRPKASRPYCSSRNRFCSTGPVNRPKPIAANATITVLQVRICISRANAASIEIGAGLASSMTSPSTSCFSN